MDDKKAILLLDCMATNLMGEIQNDNSSAKEYYDALDLAIEAIQWKQEKEEGFEFMASRRDKEDRCKNRSCNICDNLRHEKIERENQKPLITNDDGSVMICEHCGTDLMGEFTDPLEEKYCPFCGWAIDIFTTVKEGK